MTAAAPTAAEMRRAMRGGGGARVAKAGAPPTSCTEKELVLDDCSKMTVKGRGDPKSPRGFCARAPPPDRIPSVGKITYIVLQPLTSGGRGKRGWEKNADAVRREVANCRAAQGRRRRGRTSLPRRPGERGRAFCGCFAGARKWAQASKPALPHTPSRGLVARTDTTVQTRELAGSLDQFK